MKKSFLLFAAIAMIVSFSTAVMAQTSAEVAATPAGAVLVKVMTLSQTAPLHFGSIVLVSNAGGTVVLPSNSTERVFDGGVATSLATPIATNAAYNVTGTINETYALTLPTTTIVTHTTLSSGVYQMDITLMKAKFNGAGDDATTSTLSDAGTGNFKVGGTLTVKINQLGGIYSGTFPVSVDYN
jgi:Domain of unknown function (DUF4402)